MGTSYGKLTVVVNQKQWLKRRQPQRPTDPRAAWLATADTTAACFEFIRRRGAQVRRGTHAQDFQRSTDWFDQACFEGPSFIFFSELSLFWKKKLWLFANFIFRKTIRNIRKVLWRSNVVKNDYLCFATLPSNFWDHKNNFSNSNLNFL